MFVDRAVIHVKAGDGGDGKVSFRREKYVPKGGPDGGDGGDGGDVIAVGDPGRNTLLDFRHRRDWAVPPAQGGRGKNQYGSDSPDLEILLPPGTLIFDDATGAQIADIRAGDRVVIAKGGRGGLGNDRFKSSTNQAPRQASPGVPGESRTLRLELKLIADVGLVGMPNAGKSTLLASVTRATPKIADYPFTTLSPQLGIAELDAERRIVVADLPGLIEGAAQGAGLGHEFLRHVERTRVLVHVIEVSPTDGSSPAENYETIRREIGAYSAALAEKPEIIALSKTDLLGGEREIEAAVARLRRDLKLGSREEVFPISAAVHSGLRPLLEACWAILGGSNAQAAEAAASGS